MQRQRYINGILMARKHLYLLRHAHALERQGTETDFDRGLSPRGLQNSTRMGIHIKGKDIHFDVIVSSPAKRAFTTASLVAEQIQYGTELIVQSDDIYEASVRNLLNEVNRFETEWNSVLMVGHNPAISYLAEYISDAEIGAMSTCGLVCIEFESLKWEEITEKSGNLLFYITPDELNF